MLLGFIVIIVGSCLAIAVARGLDFVETVGFLFRIFPLMLMVVVTVGAALYGVTFLMGSRTPMESGEEKKEDHSSDIANLVP